MPLYALLLAYEGSEFCGWATSAGRRSVSSDLHAALRRLGEPGELDACSRTDAGVHARGQVALLQAERNWEPQQLGKSLNHQLPPDCCCQAAAALPDAWQASEQVSGKTYAYRLDIGLIPNPFLVRTGYRPACLPDPQALQRCAELIPGTRDWQAFSRRGETRTDLIRRIETCRWQIDEVTAVCTITGQGFVYRLVRSLVGAMIAVANGTCQHDELIAALNGQASAAAKQQAPARGLCLEQIHFHQSPDWHSPA
jgi:tRNA pseudouridine38-40 synthase